jgi:hypothetical protein
MTTATAEGITFPVDDVRPASDLLPEWKTHVALEKILSSRVECCSDYFGPLVKGISYQPLLAAVHTAYSQHRPLTLSPDAVWITITQGVAHHMLVHGERLRQRFVTHSGKLDLVYECEEWSTGSPDNPWPDAFEAWCEAIRNHVGHDLHDALICDFTTSGPVEKAASRIVMMDVFERYYHYVVLSICGIPSVTLLGTPADWRRLTEKTESLRVFDLDWWLKDLIPICRHFEQASLGDVDQTHWQRICKLREEYGGDIINGWVARLFPYLREFANGPCTDRNPIFETGEGFSTFSAPSGLSRVPVTWRDLRTGRSRSLEAVGGLVGVAQNPNTLALQPKVGWAIREAEKMDVLLARVAKDHITYPGDPKEKQIHSALTPELAKFYDQTNGAKLCGGESDVFCTFVAKNKLERLSWGWFAPHWEGNDWPQGQIWFGLAYVGNEKWLALNIGPTYPSELKRQFRSNPGSDSWENLVAICICHIETMGVPGKNPVVALSFSELLERMLNHPKLHYWEDKSFASYGDAEEFTRRN